MNFLHHFVKHGDYHVLCSDFDAAVVTREVVWLAAPVLNSLADFCILAKNIYNKITYIKTQYSKPKFNNVLADKELEHHPLTDHF